VRIDSLELFIIYSKFFALSGTNLATRFYDRTPRLYTVNILLDIHHRQWKDNFLHVLVAQYTALPPDTDSLHPLGLQGLSDTHPVRKRAFRRR
jgi:hypothetical protein